MCKYLIQKTCLLFSAATTIRGHPWRDLNYHRAGQPVPRFFAAAYLCSPTYPRLWNKPAYRYAKQRPRVAWWWVFRDSVIIAFEVSEPVISRVRARFMPLSTRLRYACSAKMNRYRIEDTKKLSGRAYVERYLQISYIWILF